MSQITDTQYQEHTITSVENGTDGYSIGMDTGWHLMVPLGPVTPKVGDAIRLYGRGDGYAVRGIAINGHTFRYRTEQEWQADAEKEQADKLLKDWEQYQASTAEREAAIAALPEPFQRRLRRFLDNAPETAWRHQGYELAVCQAAVAIHAACPDVKSLDIYRAMHWNRQMKATPTLDALDLSGNQFGMACRLAFWAITKPENVWKEHAAISILTGCGEAGCPPVLDHD